MESFISIMADLSSVIGIPATIGLAWAAFVIHDHNKRIEQLEDDLKEANKARAGELNAIYNRINDMSNAIYNRLNDMSSNVSYIKGVLSERYGTDKPN